MTIRYFRTPYIRNALFVYPAFVAVVGMVLWLILPGAF